MEHQRSTFPVSCKIALYNPNHTKVLVADYGHGKYGLIGGHMEPDEQPTDTIRREIQEELGLDYQGMLLKVGFDIVNRTSDKKLCLQFVGELDEATHCVVTEMDAAIWVSLDDIHTRTINIGDYASFVLANA